MALPCSGQATALSKSSTSERFVGRLSISGAPLNQAHTMLHRSGQATAEQNISHGSGHGTGQDCTCVPVMALPSGILSAFPP